MDGTGKSEVELRSSNERWESMGEGSGVESVKVVLDVVGVLVIELVK